MGSEGRAWPSQAVLTDGAGHEVDPGRLHLDVEPVAVRHEQPWGESTPVLTGAGEPAPGEGSGTVHGLT